mgnify:FL=1
MRVVLVDAGGANLGSVRYALQRLGVEPEVTTHARAIGTAERVMLPGVSTAAQVMGRLRELGLVETLRGLQAPLLGVCVGMQLLFERSEEGDVECLGLLPGVVRKLPAAPGIRVPHMGWNGLRAMRPSPLLDGVADGASAYFVHSYAAPITPDTVAATDHGSLFASVVQRGRLCGAQFHPERSAAAGARILRNFIEMDS